MNERWKELAEQATNDCMGVDVLDKQKFAELIVQECLVTLDSITAADRDALWIARKVIADHFGVEE